MWNSENIKPGKDACVIELPAPSGDTLPTTGASPPSPGNQPNLGHTLPSLCWLCIRPGTQLAAGFDPPKSMLRILHAMLASGIVPPVHCWGPCAWTPALKKTSDLSMVQSGTSLSLTRVTWFGLTCLEWVPHSLGKHRSPLELPRGVQWGREVQTLRRVREQDESRAPAAGLRNGQRLPEAAQAESYRRE